jgi:hypothetical protein
MGMISMTVAVGDSAGAGEVLSLGTAVVCLVNVRIVVREVGATGLVGSAGAGSPSVTVTMAVTVGWKVIVIREAVIVLVAEADAATDVETTLLNDAVVVALMPRICCATMVS